MIDRNKLGRLFAKGGGYFMEQSMLKANGVAWEDCAKAISSPCDWCQWLKDGIDACDWETGLMHGQRGPAYRSLWLTRRIVIKLIEDYCRMDWRLSRTKWLKINLESIKLIVKKIVKQMPFNVIDSWLRYKKMK